MHQLIPIPFGAQYYRAPTPQPDKWQRDLASMRDAGFNMIKIWAQWRWNNPKEGEFDFSDLDRLMDLAAENNLKVVINTIFDVPPAWFYRKHPNSLMIFADGRKIHPRAIAWRQIGGAPGPCYHHEPGQKLRSDFLREILLRFREHPALELWDLWNEPELTCGIMREPRLENLLCYCPASVAEFRIWLTKKYGTVDALNWRWNRNYKDWDEVEPPYDPGTFNDMIDWRLFFTHTLVEELKMRVKVAREMDIDHPVMVHTVPPPWFNMITCSSDDERLAELCDLFGNTAGCDPYHSALARSCAPGKKIINSEVHIAPGNTFHRAPRVSFNEFKRYIFPQMSQGVKGFLFWQYRPETLGQESPAWGLVDLEGEKTDLLEYSIRVNGALQKNAEALERVKPVPSAIAVIRSPENEIFEWCCSRDPDRYFHSVHGVFRGFYRSGYNVDVISTRRILEKGASRYRMIYYPVPYYMDEKVADVLRNWVSEGGVLVSEACFAGVRSSDGMHSTIIPGFGFHEVFGAREGEVLTSPGCQGHVGKWSQDHLKQNQWVINMEKELACMKKGDKALGFFFREALVPSSAEVLASFEDGAPALTLNHYGKGTAIMIGTLLGHLMSTRGDDSNTGLFASLVVLAGIDPVVKTSLPFVRADLLTAENTNPVLIVSNEKEESVDVEISFTTPDLVPPDLTHVVDIITGQKYKLEKCGNIKFCLLHLEPQSSDMFLLEGKT